MFFVRSYPRASYLKVINTVLTKATFRTMSSQDEVKAIWREADCVCFDVDSTVCIDEAIDELATFLHVGVEVAEWTKSAMSGSITYQESLGKRLELMQPSRQDITRFITEHPPRLTDGIRELVEILQSNYIPVYLISGGFHSIIDTVADELKIPKTNIRANKMLFYYNGQYAGYDNKQPTCETSGKAVVINRLKSDFAYKKLVHIGDGVTDMEACPPADAFIGFGGNQIRPKVQEGAKWFVNSFQELIQELNRKSRKTDPS